jgi:hypothetical protein
MGDKICKITKDKALRFENKFRDEIATLLLNIGPVLFLLFSLFSRTENRHPKEEGKKKVKVKIKRIS